MERRPGSMEPSFTDPFPFIAKSVNGKYRYEGKEYNISSHGFARDMDFEPVLCDMDECTYVLKDTPETMENIRSILNWRSHTV